MAKDGCELLGVKIDLEGTEVGLMHAAAADVPGVGVGVGDGPPEVELGADRRRFPRLPRVFAVEG